MRSKTRQRSTRAAPVESSVRMIVFVDVTPCGRKTLLLGQVICTMKSGRSPSISFRSARQFWSLTPASRTPSRTPIKPKSARYPVCRLYSQLRIGGELRPVNLGRLLRADRVRCSSASMRGSIPRPESLLWLYNRRVLGTQLIGAIGKATMQALYAQMLGLDQSSKS